MEETAKKGKVGYDEILARFEALKGGNGTDVEREEHEKAKDDEEKHRKVLPRSLPETDADLDALERKAEHDVSKVVHETDQVLSKVSKIIRGETKESKERAERRASQRIEREKRRKARRELRHQAKHQNPEKPDDPELDELERSLMEEELTM